MKLFIGLSLVFASLTGMAQSDAAAKAELDQIINKIKAYPAFEISFEYSLTNKAAGVKDKFDGSAIVQGDNYSLEVMGYHQLFNGSTLVTVMKDDEEIMITAPEEDEAGLSPSSLLNIYETGMKVAYGDKLPVDGEQIQIIVLSPIDASDKSYHRIEMGINQKTQELKFIYEYGKNGSVTGYKLKSLKDIAAK